MPAFSLKNAAILLAAPGLALAVPAAAAPAAHSQAGAGVVAGMSVQHRGDRGRHEGWERGRGHERYEDRYRGSYRGTPYRGASYRYNDRYYGEPVYRDTRIWRARDGNYYCRRSDGTTGLLVGAALGGLIGNQVADRRDRGAATIIGAIGGAILGSSIDRSNARCR